MCAHERKGSDVVVVGGGAIGLATALALADTGRKVTELSDAAEVEVWDGFRPTTPDDMTVLGPDPGLPSLIHASGHFRNGILLTPITAELVVTSVEGRADTRLAPFRADRLAP